MKRVEAVGATFLSFVLLGATAFGFAQHGRQNEKGKGKAEQARPAEHARQPQHARPQQRVQQRQPARPPERAQQPQRARPAERAQQPQRSSRPQERVQQRQPARPPQRAQARQPYRPQQHAEIRRTPQQRYAQQREQRTVWQEHRARNWNEQHRDWRERGGYHGYRVPDNDYRRYYGREHWFHVYNRPFRIVGGYPSFEYGGYWVTIVDPYPQYWGDDWFENDDVYVQYYDGGYYLYDMRYPNTPGIAVSISF